MGGQLCATVVAAPPTAPGLAPPGLGPQTPRPCGVSTPVVPSGGKRQCPQAEVRGTFRTRPPGEVGCEVQIQATYTGSVYQLVVIPQRKKKQ